jgi:two-component system NtrC family response regulator
MMRQALERSQGNRAAAARLMGLTYKAFLYRLEKHGMAGDDDGGVTESPEMGS